MLVSFAKKSYGSGRGCWIISDAHLINPVKDSEISTNPIQTEKPSKGPFLSCKFHPRYAVLISHAHSHLLKFPPFILLHNQDKTHLKKLTLSKKIPATFSSSNVPNQNPIHKTTSLLNSCQDSLFSMSKNKPHFESTEKIIIKKTTLRIRSFPSIQGSGP